MVTWSKQLSKWDPRLADHVCMYTKKQLQAVNPHFVVLIYGFQIWQMLVIKVKIIDKNIGFHLFFPPWILALVNNTNATCFQVHILGLKIFPTWHEKLFGACFNGTVQKSLNITYSYLNDSPNFFCPVSLFSQPLFWNLHKRKRTIRAVFVVLHDHVIFLQPTFSFFNTSNRRLF